MKKRTINLLCIIALVFVHFSAQAQDLLDVLEKELPKSQHYQIAPFKMTRIGLGHATETRKKGALEISLYNRFWNHTEEKTQHFLADEVNTRIGLDYALSDNLTLGIGYSNFDKATDALIKYALLKPGVASSKSSINITFVQAASRRENTITINPEYNPTNEKSIDYGLTSQVLISKAFSRKFSLQIAPTYIHRFSEPKNALLKNQVSFGVGARYKLNAHVALVTERYFMTNPLKLLETYNPFMIGVNWELSHLLLQFHLTNARNFAEDLFVSKTTNNFNFHDGNLHFGFNATFVLHTNKKKHLKK